MSLVSDRLRSEIMTRRRTLGKSSLEACIKGYRDNMRHLRRNECPYRMPLARYWRLGWDNAANDRRGGR